MERWQWQVVEAVYAAAQGIRKKAEAVARLHRLELLFRKTGHVTAEITATGCRGLVSIAMPNHDISAVRQLLMRSVYLAQEQKQQAEEVAAAVADKCALKLSWVVVGKDLEEAVGWYRLQRAPEMTVPRFRHQLVMNVLCKRTGGRFRIHEARLQVRKAAREAMMMSTGMRDNEPHLVRDILHIYEGVALAAAAAVVETQQLSLEIFREALALGSSSRSAGLLSIGDDLEWRQWARTREEFIWYRMGRLLFKLTPGDDANLAAEALAMFANSLQCALQDDRWPDEECVPSPRPPKGISFSAQSHDEKCVLKRANACFWAGLLINQILTGTKIPEQLVQCSVLGEVAAPPISLSQAMTSLVDAAVALIRFPQWQGVMMGHIETVLMHLVAPKSSGSSNRSGGADASNSLLFAGCTHTQPCCRILLSEDEMLEEGLFRLLAALLRSGEEAADAEELGAAVDWYHKAAEVARVLPPGRVADPMTQLSYRIGESQHLAGAWMESLEMLSNCLRHVLLAVSDTPICLLCGLCGLRCELSTIANDTGPPETPRHVTKAVILVHRLALQIPSPLFGEGQVGDAWVVQDADVVANGIRCMPVVQIHITLGQALCGLSKPEGVRLLEAARAAAMLQMELDGVSGRDVALAGEEFTIHGLNLYNLQVRLALAYSEVAHDSSKAAQMFELCRDMATRLHDRLWMQLRAAREWERAGDLLSAQEAVLEALDVLVPPGHASNSNSNSEVTMSNMLWGSPSDSSLEVRAELLGRAAKLVKALWPRETKHAKRKAALEALWELCRSPANNLDVYLKNLGILEGLMSLVDVYRNDEEWAVAARLLEALAPRLKALYHKDTPQWRHFEIRHAWVLSHSRQYLEAAGVGKDLLSSASEDIDDGAAAIYNAQLMVSSAYDYKRAGQHQSAATMLNRLERMIRGPATTSWPPPRPDIDDIGPKQHFEIELCMARALLAIDTSRYDQAVVGLQKAASLLEAIINDIQQRQLPVAKHLVRYLVFVLTHEAHLRNELNKDDVKGLEARIERIQTLDPDAGTVCLLRVMFLLAKGDIEEAVEPMRELFLLMAEWQEGRGGDDDSWIRAYDYGGHWQCTNLAVLVQLLESSHIRLRQPHKALLWAERGRMRLFMHRVHAQQHQEDDPEWAMDSTPNDFDRDDGKALRMLAKVLLDCGPNVALLEYSYFQQTQKLRVYILFRMSNLKLVAGFESPSSSGIGIRSKTLDCPGIEQLVKKARDSIIARPQQKGEAAAATNKNRHAQQHLAKLHSLLVAPVLKELADSCDTLIFVPDGCLSLVPFAALYDKSAGQFLIQQKQVVVAPCLRALHRCLDLQDRFFSTASTQLQQPFVAGNPFPMGLGMPQLQHAQEEAAAVADILGVKPCLGAAATKEAVVKALTHSSVVVLASHAILGPKFPAGALVLQGPSLTHDPDMASSSSSSRASTSAASNYYPPFLRAIMMDPGSDEPEAPLLMRGLQASVTDKSQVLTADELSGMRIPAGLVVLSACETGRGEVTPEGVLGLGRALLQAGAATTVLSLWKVDDQATKRLITEMFQELQKGEPVGTALRKAMLKMIQEGSSISQWAPFFIFGSPTMHLRNVTTLKGKKKTNGSSPELDLEPKMNGSSPELDLELKMNGSSPELDLELGQMNGSSPKLELGDGMQQVLRPTSDATSSASSASDQATVQAILVGTHESAWLDSSTGAICRRLFPRGLNITWGDAEQYWTWRTLDSSTNSHEVAVLKQVCWLDLRGRIKGTLTPGTVYTLSWRIRFALAPFTRGFNEHPVRFFLDTSDGQHHVVDAFLNSSSSRADPRSRVNILWGEDGWHEYEVADFSVPAAAHGQDELEVAFGMWEHSGNWKCGLYVDSVVLRPRQAPSRKDAP